MNPEAEKPGEEYAKWQAPKTGGLSIDKTSMYEVEAEAARKRAELYRNDAKTAGSAKERYELNVRARAEEFFANNPGDDKNVLNQFAEENPQLFDEWKKITGQMTDEQFEAVKNSQFSSKSEEAKVQPQTGDIEKESELKRKVIEGRIGLMWSQIRENFPSVQLPNSLRETNDVATWQRFEDGLSQLYLSYNRDARLRSQKVPDFEPKFNEFMNNFQ